MRTISVRVLEIQEILSFERFRIGKQFLETWLWQGGRASVTLHRYSVMRCFRLYYIYLSWEEITIICSGGTDVETGCVIATERLTFPSNFVR